ncbi:MAG TPA: tRNA uridine-5-carboxymethylaminomethyl(34) synthesis GTPase MnmE, partial [Erysipelotrichaceae bacterium]|nr:tRNA uridine-5-carboxymethylaminomethyl(34) synthesis GTPase MnmE [Erysipelotrichaceae bacterium]
MNDDIIAAIATSRLEAAISIIRLSGKDVIAFVQSFFSGRIIDKKTQTLTYGYIMD